MVPMSLAPSMESKPIREVAYETLKNAIVTGEIPAGSRVEVHGRSYVAAKVSRFEGFNGRVHHWEVELR